MGQPHMARHAGWLNAGKQACLLTRFHSNTSLPFLHVLNGSASICFSHCRNICREICLTNQRHITSVRFCLPPFWWHMCSFPNGSKRYHSVCFSLSYSLDGCDCYRWRSYSCHFLKHAYCSLWKVEVEEVQMLLSDIPLLTKATNASHTIDILHRFNLIWKFPVYITVYKVLLKIAVAWWRQKCVFSPHITLKLQVWMFSHCSVLEVKDRSFFDGQTSCCVTGLAVVNRLVHACRLQLHHVSDIVKSESIGVVMFKSFSTKVCRSYIAVTLCMD